jgi:hypothetical protein
VKSEVRSPHKRRLHAEAIIRGCQIEPSGVSALNCGIDSTFAGGSCHGQSGSMG